MPVSSKDVARKAGVSHTTVSLDCGKGSRRSTRESAQRNRDYLASIGLASSSTVKA